MIRALAYGGCKGIVFAGGDPSLRADIDQLVAIARTVGLRTELQTNADHRSAGLDRALSDVDLVGLSVDGASPEIHDRLRGRSGNHTRTISLLADLKEMGKPTIVRSVVVRQNSRQFAELARLLSPYENVVRWSVLQFSAVGEGYRRASEFMCSSGEFEKAVEAAKEGWNGGASLDVYRNTDKSGAYLLITPDGLAYGTGATLTDGAYPIAGSLLTLHMSEIAASLPFVATRHRERYGSFL
jgi:MoaA/NifB/PqqE/SkfB family radical SAM enzyme